MSGNSGFVLNLKGSGFEMMLDKGFRTADELGDWMTRHADGFKGARFDVIKVKDLNSTVKMIEEKGGAMARMAVQGEKMLDSVPGGHFLSKKAELALKLGGAAIATFGASGQAFSATGDFNEAATAGYNAGKNEISTAINPKERFTRGAGNILDGNISEGASQIIEGASDALGLGFINHHLDADAMEKNRVEPYVQNLFKTKGAAQVTQEIIAGREDAKYILSANSHLPRSLPSGNGQDLPLEEALKNKGIYSSYTRMLENKIQNSSGDERKAYQQDLESVEGYKQALGSTNDLTETSAARTVSSAYHGTKAAVSDAADSVVRKASHVKQNLAEAAEAIGGSELRRAGRSALNGDFNEAANHTGRAIQHAVSSAAARLSDGVSEVKSAITGTASSLISSAGNTLSGWGRSFGLN